MRKMNCIVLVMVMLISIAGFGNGAINVSAATSYALEYDSLSADVKSNCVAFARYKVPSLPGGLYTLDDKKAIINGYVAKVGAIAITTGNSSYGHVAYVESVSGTQVTTLNGGWQDGTHIGRWTASESVQGIVGYWYPDSLVVSDTTAPTVSGIYQDNFTSTGYTLHFTVSDNNALDYVKVFSWTGNTPQKTEDITLSGNTQTISYNVNYSDFNNEKSGYIHAIWCYDKNGNRGASPYIYVESDEEAPIVSNIYQDNFTSTGYTLHFTVSE